MEKISTISFPRSRTRQRGEAVQGKKIRRERLATTKGMQRKKVERGRLLHCLLKEKTY
jgi:hypothetical protein